MYTKLITDTGIKYWKEKESSVNKCYVVKLFLKNFKKVRVLESFFEEVDDLEVK